MQMTDEQIRRALAGRNLQDLVDEVFGLAFQDGVARKIHGAKDPDIANQLEQKLVALKELVGAGEMDTGRFRDFLMDFYLDTIRAGI